MALRFDRCTIDPDAFELRRDGEVVPVEPQVLELLLFLATNPGRLVTRDELVEAVWRGRIVSEATGRPEDEILETIAVHVTGSCRCDRRDQPHVREAELSLWARCRQTGARLPAEDQHARTPI